MRCSIHQRIGLIVCQPNAVLIILGMFMQVKYCAIPTICLNDFQCKIECFAAPEIGSEIRIVLAIV